MLIGKEPPTVGTKTFLGVCVSGSPYELHQRLNNNKAKAFCLEKVHNDTFLFGAALSLEYLGIMSSQQCGPVVGTASATDRHAKDGGSRGVVIAVASDREVALTNFFQFFDHVTWFGIYASKVTVQFSGIGIDPLRSEQILGFFISLTIQSTGTAVEECFIC